jgi:hypothetical protein
MGWLVVVYVAATVFGAGVTLVDLLGFLGHGGSHDASGHDAGGHLSDGVHDGPAGDHAGPGDHGQPSHSTDHSSVRQDASPHGSVLSQDPRRAGLNLGLRALAASRTLVYFCFGFGPIGWIAHSLGSSPLASVLWSVPTGALFAATGLALRHFQGTVLNSQVREEELLMERAEVIVPIARGQMGKVRVTIAGRWVERYARAQGAGESFPVGASVRIVSMTEECVIVSDA